MDKARLSANNQITLPETICDKLQLEPGDVLDFLENEQGEIIIKKGARIEGLFAVLDEINHEAQQKGIKESDLLDELSIVRRNRRLGKE
ncbi:AbrB/MazE/SpoVT family DNA-binding domain-containing protein [Shimazuella sp. AN120528]|uniref:AbrB/MazE/SpoVT family DNA-binding domain-containing protein n=1 Tax=Shimazuella soli TaxID=1892854 RepID=UPI001F0D441D|nr:AbrB/MazE/SpoVT family DNA-binding domain-containing protein [Shimazuella soli]MCH5585982.1 AbrB/MazE/SpoVT family DNA-binding domain-containing protein [Shimazuella soli]